MFFIDPRGGHNRYKFDRDFFKKWTPEMAYVLGFLYADGDIENVQKSSRAHYIKFFSADKEILEAIKLSLGSEHKINYRAPRKGVYPNGKVYKNSESYCLRIGSKEMFYDLIKLGLTPRKSLTIKFPKDVPDNCLNHFIRGYFDGDGCITIGRGVGKKGQSILKGAFIIFTSGSISFLEGLKERIYEYCGLMGNNICLSSRAYYLKYGTRESIKLFRFLYNNPSNLFLKRKLDVFRKYFELRPCRVDKEIANILNG